MPPPMKRPSLATLLRWSIAALAILAAVVLLRELQPQAEEATRAAALDLAVLRLDERLRERGTEPAAPLEVQLVLEGAEARSAEEEVRARLERSALLSLGGRGAAPLLLRLDTAASGHVDSTITLHHDGQIVQTAGSQTPIRPTSVLPPLIAIVLAFATGRLILSLCTAIVAGAIFAGGPGPLSVAHKVFVEYTFDATLRDTGRLWIFVFTTALLGLVSLVTRAGGVQGLVDRIMRVAKGPRSTQFVTYLLGLAIFFDDYANTILVGNTMRPLTDRMRVSREKLAYLVDSTSAPVAGIAVISTWIGYEVGLLRELSTSLGLGVDGYSLFFQAVPYRFYCFFTLIFVAILILSRRDFGPMLTAERRAARTGMLVRPGAQALSNAGIRAARAKEGIPYLAWIALIPIGLMLVGTLVGLLWSGGALPSLVERPAAILEVQTWSGAFGAASSTLVLGVASLVSSAVAFALVFWRRLLPPADAIRAYLEGARSMWLALAILVLAWAIKATCDDLGTSHFLVAGLRDVVHPQALPLLIFLLAGIISFATGTSWGTMGILIPTAAPLAFHLAGPEIMFLSLAAVLDGAIFGDHISPLSDTSVMSSISSGSDHLDHVKTQLPYATVTFVAASIFGYIWNAMGWGYGLGWILGPGTLAAVIFLLGKDAREGLPTVEASPFRGLST